MKKKNNVIQDQIFETFRFNCTGTLTTCAWDIAQKAVRYEVMATLQKRMAARDPPPAVAAESAQQQPVQTKGLDLLAM